MTLLINTNKNFDFVDGVIKPPCLFYFRSVKFDHVKETHEVSSLLVLVKIVVASQHTKDNATNLCQDLLTTENTDSNLKVKALHYANEQLVRVRLAVPKLL